MKKLIFTVMNYLLPASGVLPMHCGANIGPDGDVACFFGLSGTGKTTLSADPTRTLLGDDEHGWSDRGIFNIEGGCYAKTIGLTREREPQIWDAIRFGAILENVDIDHETREIDLRERPLHRKHQGRVPLSHIAGASREGTAGHPRTVIFLTADASGVLPPVASSTLSQAMYHFLTGYTSKLAGTERGVSEPQPTFSACFGAPVSPSPAGCLRPAPGGAPQKARLPRLSRQHRLDGRPHRPREADRPRHHPADRPGGPAGASSTRGLTASTRSSAFAFPCAAPECPASCSTPRARGKIPKPTTSGPGRSRPSSGITSPNWRASTLRYGRPGR